MTPQSRLVDHRGLEKTVKKSWNCLDSNRFSRILHQSRGYNTWSSEFPFYRWGDCSPIMYSLCRKPSAFEALIYWQLIKAITTTCRSKKSLVSSEISSKSSLFLSKYFFLTFLVRWTIRWLSISSWLILLRPTKISFENYINHNWYLYDCR